MLYGSMVNETLLTGNSMGLKYTTSFELIAKLNLYEKKYIFRITALTIFNYFLFFPIFKLSNYLSKKEVLLNIYCRNGEKFNNKNLVNSNVNGNILIADSSSQNIINKYLIPKEEIVNISFNSINYRLGKKLEFPKAQILVPDNYSRDEEWPHKTIKNSKVIVREKRNSKKL